jgi:hypothetical protein
MEKAKVFVEIFDEDHEQKPRSRDFYFAPAATIAEIKQEVQNFIGISNVDMTVSLQKSQRSRLFPLGISRTVESFRRESQEC